jgi:hypothetical protein
MIASLIARPSQGQTYLGVDLTPGTSHLKNLGLSILGGQVGGGLGVPNPNVVGGGDHAVLWTAASHYTDLTPDPTADAYVSGLAAGQQVGQQSTPATSFYPHAFLWTGTAASALDLNPAGFLESQALATDGLHQVGSGTPSGQFAPHALLWSGLAANYVDLNPARYQFSVATGLSGNRQVGYGTTTAIGGSNHALLWSGSAASATDLNPAGFSWTEADGIHGSQIVGWGTPDNAVVAEALLWSGSTDAYVNLSPAGFTRAYARSTNGQQQVGEVGNAGSFTNGWHAALWTGTAASYVDLNRFLPAGFVSARAEAIDDQGNVAGFGYDAAGNQHALEWLAPVTGDINGDRLVNFTDLLTLAQHYGQRPATWADGDFNSDGSVNFDDLLLLAQRYGQPPAAAQLAQLSPSMSADVQQAFAQVPEPTALVGVGAVALLSIRHRRPHARFAGKSVR